MIVVFNKQKTIRPLSEFINFLIVVLAAVAFMGVVFMVVADLAKAFVRII